MDFPQAFVDFYGEHGISPVRQDISDLEKHFQRREGLYRQLGLPALCFRGRGVLEVGPGSGHNSIHVASLKPRRYLLLEGNGEGVRQLRETFERHPRFMEGTEVVQGLLEDFRTEERFDVVLCEGMIPFSPNQEVLLGKLTALVSPGGILVITCVDAVSCFAERLRRLVAHRLVDPTLPLAEKVAAYDCLYATHLTTLRFMSRGREDWYIDNLVNPVLHNAYLSLADAIGTLGNDFDVLSSSPRFFQDARWYKEIVGPERKFNERAVGQYWQFVHNFLDYRLEFVPRAPERNRELYTLCEELTLLAKAFERTRDEAPVKAMGPLFEALARNVGEFSPEHATLLLDVSAMVRDPRTAARQVADHDTFAHFFGKGQQYLSLVRDGEFGSTEGGGQMPKVVDRIAPGVDSLTRGDF